MTQDISSRALIVNLTISQWSGRKLDRAVTREVTDAHDAASDAGRFNKMLMDKAALAPIQTIANAARLYVYSSTLPWGDNGDRVLMSSNYFNFTSKLRAYMIEFEGAVDELLEKYGEYVDRARFRLNSMWNEADYPAASEIKNKFRMRYSIRPVPTADDFRVAMGQEEVEAIKEQINKDNERIMNEAMQSVWEEIRDTLSHLHTKLADPKAIFRESTIEKLDELVERIPYLNLTGDPTLETFRRELKQSLIGYGAKELRTDSVVRNQAALETQRIMDQFGGMWG